VDTRERAEPRLGILAAAPTLNAEQSMGDIVQLLDIQSLLTSVVEWVPQVVAAVLIFMAFMVGFRIIRRPLEAACRKASIQVALSDLLIDKFLRSAVMLLAVVMAADQLGINVGAALAGLGVAGIALGFAAQDSVANVIAGMLICWDKPFVVGDWIETEGSYGAVSEITLRSTRIRTTRNTFVVIPNKRVIDVTLENYSKHGTMRIDIPVGIAYKEDISAARHALLAAVESMPGLSSGHPPDVVVAELAGSSVNLNVRVWIDRGEDRRPIYARVLEASKVALDDAGIQIPFPHLQLFVDKVEDRVWTGLAATSAGRGE
jgi:small conductance mechanosensitive channel